MYRLTWLALFSWGLLMAGGCNSSQYDINSVTGTVTLDGVPLPNARVTFSPSDGRPSYGVSDENGRYELRYLRDEMGALAGSHSVSITTEYDAPAEVNLMDLKPVPNSKRPEKIPARYNRSTMLTAEVQEGPNEIDFDLQSKE